MVGFDCVILGLQKLRHICVVEIPLKHVGLHSQTGWLCGSVCVCLCVCMCWCIGVGFAWFVGWLFVSWGSWKLRHLLGDSLFDKWVCIPNQCCFGGSVCVCVCVCVCVGVSALCLHGGLVGFVCFGVHTGCGILLIPDAVIGYDRKCKHVLLFV